MLIKNKNEKEQIGEAVKEDIATPSSGLHMLLLVRTTHPHTINCYYDY